MKVINPVIFKSDGTFTGTYPNGGYFSKSGIWTLSASNTRRISYESTARALIEDYAVNLITHSENFTHWDGSAEIGTVHTAPPEQLEENFLAVGIDMTEIKDTSTSDATYRGLTVPIANDSNIYFASIFIQQFGADNSANLHLSMSGGSIAVSMWLIIDFNLRMVGSYPLRCINEELGLFRAEIPVQNNATGNTTFTFGIYPSGSTPTEIKSILAGGAQLEKNSIGATSYIKSEQERTNLLTYSEDFTHWSGDASLLSSFIDPVTGINMSVLEDDNTGSQELIYQNISVPNDSADYLLSIFLRRYRGKDIVTLSIIFDTGGTLIRRDCHVNFYTRLVTDVPTGTVIGKLTTVDPDWLNSDVMELVKVFFYFSNNSTGNTNCRVEIRPAEYVSSETGGVCAGGVQLEKNVSSGGGYIKTLASPVTTYSSHFRNQDVNSKNYYCSIPEPDYENGEALWFYSTNYVPGDRCIAYTDTLVNGAPGYRFNYIYECVEANTNYPPPGSIDVLDSKWILVGPANRWALLDTELNTVATKPQEQDLVFVYHTQSLASSSVALLNLSAPLVSVVVTKKSKVIYELAIDTTGISDYVITNLPVETGVDICIQLHKIALYEFISLGKIVFGNCSEIGGVQYGVIAGITDYSVKSVNAFGVYSIARRNYAKRNNLKLEIPNDQVDQVFSFLASMRSTPAVWIANDNDFTCLIVFGFYKDFDIDIAFPSHSFCTISIEGMI